MAKLVKQTNSAQVLLSIHTGDALIGYVRLYPPVLLPRHSGARATFTVGLQADLLPCFVAFEKNVGGYAPYRYPAARLSGCPRTCIRVPVGLLF